MAQPLKILAIQFKSLGDSVLLIPALEALRKKFPACELHALVSEAAAPLLENLPCLTRVWKIPRVRGRANLTVNWPVIRALRAEKFDRSVDFGGNDRGAILSFLCGARERLGFDEGGFLRRHLCFTRRTVPAALDRQESLRLFQVLSPWEIFPPASLKIRIFTDPAFDASGAKLVPNGTILCHMGAGRTNRQWPGANWVTFYEKATQAGLQLMFTSGENPREQTWVAELKKNCPQALFLPPALPLPQFLAALKRARGLVTGDTGPMHFAAGLDLPVIALFGPSSPAQWSPVTQNCRILTGGPCHCAAEWHNCRSEKNCMNAIPPEKVLAALQDILAEQF